jgi:hypothetical protein
MNARAAIQRRTFLDALGLGVLGAVATRSAFGASAYTLEPGPAGETLKSPDGRTALAYLVRKPEGVPLAGNSVCCFHPFNTPSGERVTDIAPADHRDHRGIFFAWQSLDFRGNDKTLRGDFWGWGRFAPTEGRSIQNREIRLASADSTSAELAIRNEWTINGETVMTEQTSALTRETQNARVLDLIFRFQSDREVVVNQVAFTGLCVRCRSDGKAYFSNAQGRVELPDSNPLKPEMNWPAADWYSHTIVLNSGKTVTTALIDHPANPESTWHEPRAVSFLNPCISALREVRLAAAKPFVLRYRVVAADGEVPARFLNSLSGEWRAAK